MEDRSAARLTGGRRHVRRGAAATGLIALLVLAGFQGCVGRDRDDRPPLASDLPLSDLAPGCDASRPAVAHRLGLVVETAVAGPISCLLATGAPGTEPTIGVTRTGAVFLPTLPEDRGTGVVRTLDDGTSWEVRRPELAGQPTHQTSYDPYLYVDPATSRIFHDDLLPGFNCSMLSWSDDDGATWDHSLAGCFEFDQQRIVAGPPRVSTTLGYPNVVYRCAMNTVAVEVAATTTTCQRSLDGGRTWLPPGGPAFVTDPTRRGHLDVPGACGAGIGHPVVAPDGRLYLAKGWCGEPTLAWSDDEGLSWTRTRVSELGMGELPSEDFGVFMIGIDDYQAAVGVDGDGDVYFAWLGPDLLPYLVVSRDGAASWSEPAPIAPLGVRRANLVELAVGGVGKIAVSYMGSTDAPALALARPSCFPTLTSCVAVGPGIGEENVTWHGYVAMSGDALEAAPTFWTTTVNDPSRPLLMGRCWSRCGAEGDFLDVTIGPDGTPWAAFVDACGAEGCRPQEGAPELIGELVAARLWGGPTLWDDEDADGPYG